MTKIYLTSKQRKQAASLIRNECANYINGDCLLLDYRACPQTITGSVCCKYFRDVLLNDKHGLDLKLELFPDNSNLKICTVCGKAYSSKGNRSKYCSDCAKKVKNRQTADCVQNKRLNVRK